MKPPKSITKLIVAISLLTMLFGSTLWTKSEHLSRENVQSGDGIALQLPAFLKSAYAQDASQADFSFLVNEAGVTAYTKLSKELDLANMELSFKTIGRKSTHFITGIIVAPGYEYLPEFGENAEVQVYLHQDGWIVAYLTQWQHASALFDWVNYDEKRLKDNTIIESVVRKLAEDAGVYDITLTYYDFRNPQATNLMLVADHANPTKRTESFEINIPRQLTIYESSWSSAQFGISANYQTRWPGSCVLDDEQLASHDPGGEQWGLWAGELSKPQLSPDKNHKLTVAGTTNGPESKRSYCGIAIVYREARR